MACWPAQPAPKKNGSNKVLSTDLVYHLCGSKRWFPVFTCYRGYLHSLHTLFYTNPIKYIIAGEYCGPRNNSLRRMEISSALVGLNEEIQTTDMMNDERIIIDNVHE